MIKILLFILIIFNYYCFSFKENKRYNKIFNKIKNKEEILVESALKKYNLKINLQIVNFNNVAFFLDDFQTRDEANNNGKIFIYFFGEKSKHLRGKNTFWGHYYVHNKIIILNKDIIYKFNKEKQIGIVTHEIGHMLGLQHYEDNKCNFMLSGVDNCKTYNYNQINILKQYIDNNLSKGDQKKYMFDKENYLETINNLKENKTMTLYLILD